MEKRVASSARLEEAIAALLAEGVAESDRLAEIGRLGGAHRHSFCTPATRCEGIITSPGVT